MYQELWLFVLGFLVSSKFWMGRKLSIRLVFCVFFFAPSLGLNLVKSVLCIRSLFFAFLEVNFLRLLTSK